LKQQYHIGTEHSAMTGNQTLWVFMHVQCLSSIWHYIISSMPYGHGTGSTDQPIRARHIHVSYFDSRPKVIECLQI